MRTKLLLLITFISLQVSAQCWDKISSGLYHTIAIASDGKLWSWGYNNSGQLGDGTTVDKNYPVQIGTDNDWVAIGTGYYHSFAIKSNGTLWAWGNNQYGQLGKGTTGAASNSSVPTQIGTETNWSSITGGEYFTLALKTDGTMWSVGKNTNGQLGINNLVDQNIFQQVGTDANWNKIACGRSHSIAIKNDETLFLWGANGGGQLGLTHTVDRRIPTLFASNIYFKEIAGGISSTIAIETSGKIYRAGYGCPIPSSTYTMTEYVVSPANWNNVKIGSNFVVATKTDGSMWVIGNNDYGQFGNVSFSSSNIFTQPILNNGWSINSNHLQVNIYSIIALNSSGQLFGTGQNHVGQLGDSSLIQRTSFVSVNCPFVLENESFDLVNNFILYPNPVKNTLNISLQDNPEIQKLMIYDITGKQVKYEEGNVNSINVEDLKSGFYLLKITINDKTEVRKFLKQ